MSRTTASPLVHAASVLPLRDAPLRDAPLRDGTPGESEVQILCMRRSANASFMPGAVVFPGGKLEATDLEEALSLPFLNADAASQWGSAWPILGADEAHFRETHFIEGQYDNAIGSAVASHDAAHHALGLAVAALREALEEVAILAARDSLGNAPDQEACLALRKDWQARSSGWLRWLSAQGLVADLSALRPWGRWITPPHEKRRFDARFFLLRVPTGQLGEHDQQEAADMMWASPKRLLAEAASGSFVLPPPTLRHVELLSGISTVTEAFALAARQSLLPVQPFFHIESEPIWALPGDPLHPILQQRVAGTTRIVLRDGKLCSV